MGGGAELSLLGVEPVRASLTLRLAADLPAGLGFEKGRFRGSCYAAANWTCIGESAGRGRNDRFHQESVPIKTHWLYALRPDYRQVLCRPLS